VLDGENPENPEPKNWDAIISSWADKVAKDRDELHKGVPFNSITGRSSYQLHRQGMKGEFEFGRFSGKMPNLTPMPGGDPGFDFDLPLVFKVEVKTRTWRGGELDLLVEVEDIEKADIYVLAIEYHDGRVVLAGWAWRSEMKKNEPRAFPGKPLNYWLERKKLNSMDTLAARLVRYI